MSETELSPAPSPAPVRIAGRSARRWTIGVITAGALGVAALIVAMVLHAERRINKVALASLPQPVSTVAAVSATYLKTRTYVGTLEPWTTANVGPQFVSAYVETVRVRPGAVVKRSDILATLDCRNVSSSTQAIAANARATNDRQQALAHQLTRLHGLLDSGFISTDDLEQKSAQSQAETEQLASERDRLAAMSLEVDDCVLRAPFDGDVTDRTVDPGAFVRPGASIVSLTDRRTVRFTADVPEDDFLAVGTGKSVRIHVDALDRDLVGTIARRTPSADPATRTIHFEVDLDNSDRSIPVNTTGVATLDVGAPMPAVEIPLQAATVRNGKAILFVVADGVAHQTTVPVLGEQGALLFVEDSLRPGTAIVTEGRTVLADGDKVDPKPAPAQPATHRPAAARATQRAALKQGLARATPREKAL